MIEQLLGIACNVLETSLGDILERAAERLHKAGELSSLSSICVTNGYSIIEYLCKVRLCKSVFFCSILFFSIKQKQSKKKLHSISGEFLHLSWFRTTADTAPSPGVVHRCRFNHGGSSFASLYLA